MMAGRNISATHVAFTSARVMATCACIGQAVGTAASVCVKEKLAPRELARDAARVKRLQQLLLRDDQTLRGVRNEDELDLARQARAAASSEEPHAPASNVLDGWVRDIPGKEIHQWQGRLKDGSAWIELRWPKPVRISEVRITFDTGFQRELTLTSSESVHKGIIRGAQPETVRDYVLEAQGKHLARVTGNYQRLRRHRFEPVETDRLRLTVTATNGSELARVFEIRCYA